MYDLEGGLQPKVPKRNYRNFLCFSIILKLQQMTIQSAVKRCDDMVNMWNCAAPTELEIFRSSVFSIDIPLLRSSFCFWKSKPFNQRNYLRHEARAQAGQKAEAAVLWMPNSLAVLAKPLVVCISSYESRRKCLVLLEPLSCLAERAAFFLPWFFGIFVSRQKYEKRKKVNFDNFF